MVMEMTYFKQLKNLLDEDDKLAALCNVTAFLFETIDDVNWVGFYFIKNNELVLGPFQGRVACTRLKLNKGVCAFAINTRQLIVVNNVHEFEGHIACDERTNAELVVPLKIGNKIIGVLDVDSLSLNRFKKEDEDRFEIIARLISERLRY